MRVNTFAQCCRGEPPEPTSSCLGDNSSLAMHLKPPEVDDVENSINRIEADIDRSIKPFFDYLVQSPTVWIDSYHRAPHRWSSGRRHRCLVAEKCHENLSGPLMCSCRRHIEFHRCRMGREADQRSAR